MTFDLDFSVSGDVQRTLPALPHVCTTLTKHTTSEGLSTAAAPCSCVLLVHHPFLRKATVSRPTATMTPLSPRWARATLPSASAQRVRCEFAARAETLTAVVAEQASTMPVCLANILIIVKPEFRGCCHHCSWLRRVAKGFGTRARPGEMASGPPPPSFQLPCVSDGMSLHFSLRRLARHLHQAPSIVRCSTSHIHPCVVNKLRICFLGGEKMSLLSCGMFHAYCTVPKDSVCLGADATTSGSSHKQACFYVKLMRCSCNDVNFVLALDFRPQIDSQATKGDTSEEERAAGRLD